eukprot:CAMPEP_0168628900 /NCGR_PEP_ID=MMETSP0449_2-20121227/12097_1 /TAXON_ID=1082188 /ORGANISM="Strombidium rassoulzadegani, Strain ras09" /LENGTH=163 /DNA_ID=CAMNT_0008671363 /DNA_START=304 /DNA_END=795 /DNA_ORIENTATION=-
MTFITLSTGLYIQFKYPTEYSISSQYEASKRHNPFQAWKFHIFVYELALVSEIIITIFFWTLLPLAPSYHPSDRLYFQLDPLRQPPFLDDRSNLRHLHARQLLVHPDSWKTRLLYYELAVAHRGNCAYPHCARGRAPLLPHYLPQHLQDKALLPVQELAKEDV